MFSKYILAALDVFVYILTVVVAIVALSKVDDNKKKGNIIDPAQYLIEMNWEDKSPNDLDLWVKNPNGDIVSFGNKDVGLMTLDRDDLGVNNSATTVNGIVTNPVRREVVSLRGLMTGTYTVNVMMYTNRDGQVSHPKITVRRLNPYKEVLEKTIEVVATGQLVTVVNFTLDADGNVTQTNEDDTPLTQVLE